MVNLQFSGRLCRSAYLVQVAVLLPGYLSYANFAWK